MNLIKEIAKSRLKFFIVEEINSSIDEVAILEKLRLANYHNEYQKLSFLDLKPYESRKPQKGIASYIGIINNHLIIKDIGIHSETYVRKLSELFPDKKITRVISLQFEGDDSVTGTIVQSYMRKNLILHIRKIGKNNDDVLYDKYEEFIHEIDQSSEKEIDKDYAFKLTQNILTSKLGLDSLDNFEIKQFNQVRFLEFNQEDDISRVIQNHFPSITDAEISSAWVGAYLRPLVGDSFKSTLFPNTTETKEIVANVLRDLVSDDFEFLKSKFTFKRKNQKTEDEITIGGTDRFGFSITFKKRFKYLERICNSIEAKIGDSQTKHKIYITNNVEQELETKLFLGGSWHNFATQLYYHLRHGMNNLYPLFTKFEDLSFVNQYVNYSEDRNDCFLGGRCFKEWNKPQLANCVVAYLLNDDQKERIAYDKLYSINQSHELNTKYKQELEKIKPADNKP